MRRRIFWSMLAVIAVAVLISVAATSVLRQRLINDRQRELSRQAEVTARLIEEQVSQVGSLDARGARVRIRGLLEQVSRIGGHDYVEAAAIGQGGNVLSLVDDSPLLDSVQPRIQALQRSDLQFSSFQTEVEGDPIIATLQIIEPDSATAPRLLIAIGREEPLLQTQQLTVRAWLAFGIAAVLAAILAAVLARRIGRRLEHVGDAARRLAGGDFAVRARVDGSDDVTQLAIAFNEMAAELEATRQREHEFLLSVGHDLRTPLTTIRGYAEGLHRGVITEEDLPRVASVIDTQTGRLSRLIEDLMLLARLEAREFSMQHETVELSALTRGLLDAEEARATRLGIALNATLEDVGPVYIDPDRYGQMLGNLLDNAFRYSPEGSEVDVFLRRDTNRIELRVVDSGPGIEEGDLDRVFERLYVAQRYRALRPEGSGLGLSIVRELVAAMGGHVWVESTVGVGSSLIVTIPGGDPVDPAATHL